MQSVRRLLCWPADADDEMLKAHNIYTSIAALGPKVWGFVYQCTKGHYHIVAADWLGQQERVLLFMHEAWHILNDFPKTDYVIGLNQQWCPRERRANRAAKTCERRGMISER